MPECVCPFAIERDPGMLDEDIRFATEWLSLSCLIGTLGIAVWLLTGVFWTPYVWGPWLFAGIFNGVIWLVLILNKRRRKRNGWVEVNPVARDGEISAGLDRSIRAVWADAWLVV